MKLNVFDRLAILGTLPQKSDMGTLVISVDIRKKTELSQKELGKIDHEILNIQGKISEKFDEKKAENFIVDIKFSESEKNLIKIQLKDLDSKKELTNAHINIWKLFC